MFITNQKIKLCFGLISGLLVAENSFAHDPVFSPGPHVLFKNGFEVHTEFTQAKHGNKRDSEQAVALKYGLSGDWVAGFEVPYKLNKNGSGTKQGFGDITLSTKYRFWRNDSLGVQETAAIIAKIEIDSGNKQVSSSTTDTILGFTYGYESLKWYRWTSIRYRFNQNRVIENLGDLRRGDRLFVDFAGGYRPQVNDYREADTVWLLELNGEYSKRNALNSVGINDSGGSQWFVSPGIMWTKRNFAVKAGVQIPVYSNVNGSQPHSDYRARLEFEWHL